MRHLIKFFFRYWPLIGLLAVWIIFAKPYIFDRLVPFPSDYLVTFFPPWSASFGVPVKNAAMPDIIDQIYPWKMLTIKSWMLHEIPFFNPFSFSGTFHAANYQSAVFSPVNLLFFIAPFIDAWSISVLLQPLLIFFGMYLFLRQLGHSRPGAFIGAVSFGLCGFVTVWMEYSTLVYAIAFLPWCLWAMLKYGKTGNYFYFLLVSVTVCFSLLSGHFQTSLYLIATAVMFLWWGRVLKRRDSIKLMAAVLLGIGLAAPQLLLTREAFSLSSRSFNFLTSAVIPWQYLVTVFAPDFYGNPVTRNDWLGYYAEWCSYAGVVPLFLAWLALKQQGLKIHKFWIVLMLLSLCMAYNTPLSYLVYKLKIPVISTSAGWRIIVLWSFSVSVLSASGTDYVLSQKKSGFRKVVGACLIPLTVLGLLWTAVLLWPALDQVHRGIALRNLILPTGLLVWGMVLVILILRFRKIRPVLLILICLTVSAEMLRFTLKWIPFSVREFVYPPNKTLTTVKDRIYDQRLVGTLGNEAGIMSEISLLGGYDSIYFNKYSRFISASSDGTPKDGQRQIVEFDKYGRYRDRAMELLSARIALYKKSDKKNIWAFPYWEFDPEVLKKIAEDEHYEVYEYLQALPRVQLLSGYLVRQSETDILKTVYDPEFNPRTEVVLEHQPRYPTRPGNGEVHIERETYNSIIVSTKSKQPQLLYLSTINLPGWKAWLDGRQTQILNANYIFQAVSLPAGEHYVTVKYLPDAFLYGLGVSIISLISLLFSKCIIRKKI